MAFTRAKLARYQAGMRRRIETLRTKTEDSLDFAIDHMMQDRVDSYFKVEEGLEEIDRTLGLIEEELEEIWDFSGALRLDSRLEFSDNGRAAAAASSTCPISSKRPAGAGTRGVPAARLPTRPTRSTR